MDALTKKTSEKEKLQYRSARAEHETWTFVRLSLQYIASLLFGVSKRTDTPLSQIRKSFFISALPWSVGSTVKLIHFLSLVSDCVCVPLPLIQNEKSMNTVTEDI